MQKSLLFLLLFFTQVSFAQSVQIRVDQNVDTIINGNVKIIRPKKQKVILYTNKDSVFTGNFTMIGDEIKDSLRKIIIDGKAMDFSFNGAFDKEQGRIIYNEKDTIVIGNMMIINSDGALNDTFHIRGDKFNFNWKDSVRFDWNRSGNMFRFEDIQPGKRKRKKEKVTTNWGIVDIGFTNVNDRTNYAAINGVNGYFPSGSDEDMILQNGKSSNINIWFFMQKASLISHVVNLKYGLGLELNNYRFKKNIRFRDEPRYFIDRDAEVSVFEKNKLAADYITVPVMLNFNFTPGRTNSYGFSAGISAGYLYSARQKMVSNERGKEKVRNDFNLQPWKLSAIAELNLGFIQLYGSYALGNMFRSGLDQVPYSAGLRFSSPE